MTTHPRTILAPGSPHRGDEGYTERPGASIAPEEEMAQLEEIAADSWYAHGVNAEIIRYCSSVFSRYWRVGSCLELGPAEGLMTAELEASFSDLTVVDGSRRFCDSIQARFPAVTVVHALFEHYEPNRRFDTIVLGHVLEHVEDPPSLLERVRRWLAPGGVICAAVPNARSVHRQAAVVMGLLRRENQMNESDRHHGHRRVYDPESFRAEFVQAGFQIEVFGGFWLKPLSHAQIEASWTPEMIRAFMIIGERYPDIAAEIYVIASS